MAKSSHKFKITNSTYLSDSTGCFTTGCMRYNRYCLCLSLSTITSIEYLTLYGTCGSTYYLAIIPCVSYLFAFTGTNNALIPVVVFIEFYIISICMLCIYAGIFIYLYVCVDRITVRCSRGVGRNHLNCTCRYSRLLGDDTCNCFGMCIIVSTYKNERCGSILFPAPCCRIIMTYSGYVSINVRSVTE